MTKQKTPAIILLIAITMAGLAHAQQPPAQMPGKPTIPVKPPGAVKAPEATQIVSVAAPALAGNPDPTPASGSVESADVQKEEASNAAGDPAGKPDPTADAPASNSEAATPPVPVAIRKDAPPEESATWVRDMPLNDLLSVLARRSNYQYFSNPSLSGISVQGQLLDSLSSIDQMRGLGLQYGVTIYERANTLYAFLPEQLAAMPKREWTYKLKYLGVHSKEDRDSLAQIIKPALSSTGTVQFEVMTRTVVVLDNECALANVQGLIEKLDRPQKQVIVKVQILRMLNNGSNKFGVDWSESLGKGVTVGATAYGQLDSLFNSMPVVGDYGQLGQTINTVIANSLTGGRGGATSATTTTSVAPSTIGTTGTTGTTGTPVAAAVATSAIPAGIVLDPVQVKAVIRALIEKDEAVQESGPTVIIKDNQQGKFSLIELIPIVTQQVSQSNGTNLISSSVTYEIDPKRETYVGLQVVMRPSILPDHTIEMTLEPKIATVTGYTIAQTGVAGITNSYPNVSETSVDSVARIPDGFSLVLSGYYQIEEREQDNKVPLLGDIPGISFAFRSKSHSKVRSNVLFVITPTTYDPADHARAVEYSEMIKQQTTPPKSLNYADDEMPGEDTKPNLMQRLRNILPFKEKKRRIEVDPEHPANIQGSPKLTTRQQAEQERIRKQILATKSKDVEVNQ